MKTKKKLLILLSVLVGLPCVLAQQYALYLEQSPVQGGSVSPNGGTVHNYSPGERVTVSAVPAEGYEFVYWLGAVSDTTTSTTTISVDGPRYVLAVFERTEYENEPAEAINYAGAGGGGHLTANPRTVSNSGPSISQSGSSSTDYSGGGGEIPIPTPEPTTLVLLFAGTGGLFLKRKRK